MRRILRWTINAVAAAVRVSVTVVLVYALQARRQPDLQPWHTQAPHLERENPLFEETRNLLKSALTGHRH